MAERQHWDDYMRAYEDAITATSTKWAPWYVIPADHKPLMRTLVAGVLVETIRSLELTAPTVSPQQHARRRGGPPAAGGRAAVRAATAPLRSVR